MVSQTVYRAVVVSTCLAGVLIAESFASNASSRQPVAAAISECTDYFPENICNALWDLVYQLQGFEDNDCAGAASALRERLEDPLVGSRYWTGEPYSAYMNRVNGVVQYPLNIGNQFMSRYNEGIGPQVIVHELMGHYQYGYTDENMPEGFGGECNQWN